MRDHSDTPGFLRASLDAEVAHSSGPFTRGYLQAANIVANDVRLNTVKVERHPIDLDNLLELIVGSRTIKYLEEFELARFPSFGGSPSH